MKNSILAYLTWLWETHTHFGGHLNGTMNGISLDNAVDTNNRIIVKTRNTITRKYDLRTEMKILK